MKRGGTPRRAPKPVFTCGKEQLHPVPWFAGGFDFLDQLLPLTVDGGLHIRGMRIPTAALAIFPWLALGLMSAAEGSIPAKQLAQLKSSTVLVLTSEGSGSGFVCQQAGEGTVLVATNAHVVGFASGVQVVLASGTPQERILDGSIVAVSRSPDLALIRISGKDLPTPLESAAQDTLSETQGIWVLGFPFGDELRTGAGHPAITVTRGSITSLRRNDKSTLSVVQIDADINPGNSGGPVVDSEGHVVGIATAKIDGTGVGLAIPAAAVSVLVAGRVESFAWETQDSDERRATYRFTANVADPLRRIVSVSVLLAPRSQVSGTIAENALAIASMREEACAVADGQARATVVFKAGKDSTTEQVFQVAVKHRDGSVTRSAPQQFVVEFTAKAKAADVHPTEPVVVHKPGDEWIKDKTVAGVVVQAGATTLTASGKALFGDPFEVGDAVVRTVDLSAKGVIAKPLHSADGKVLFILSQTGQLHQIALPAGTETQVLDLHEQTTCFAQSRDGVLVYLPRTKELVLIDSHTLTIMHRIPLPQCDAIAASAGSHLVYATCGADCTLIDASKGQTLKHITANSLETVYGSRIKKHPQGASLFEFAGPALTPDGHYLLCQSNSCLVRFRCDGTDLVYEEMGPRVGRPGGNWLQISEDGSYVALSSGGSSGDITDHPKVAGDVFYVYSVANLQRPASTIMSGYVPQALAFDKAAAQIYTNNNQQQLLVFTTQGAKGKEYRFTKEGQTRQLVAFPDGFQVLVMTDEDLFWVSLPGPDGVVKGNKQAAKSTGWLQPLVKITAKPSAALPPLPAKIARDAQGASFVEMSSVGQLVELGTDVAGVAVAPSGTALYVIHTDDPIVSVVDPATWKVVTEIAVPKAPTSLWCDGALIAVACPDSQVVVLIDPLKNELIRSVRFPEHPTWRPVAICGRSPNGGIASLWQADPFKEYLPRLVQINLDGTAQVVCEGENDGCRSGVWLPGGRVFFGLRSQSEGAGTGALMQPFKAGLQLELKRDLFKDYSAFDRNCGAVFVTQDNAALVLPRFARDIANQAQLSTVLLSPHLDQVLMQMPGVAICEVPDRQLFITVDEELVPSRLSADLPMNQKSIQAQVRYIARTTGRTLRVVHLTTEPGLDIKNSRFSWIYNAKLDLGAVYIPGHEILLVPRNNAVRPLEFAMYRCGPPAGVTDLTADTPVTASNDPPTTGQAGSALQYQPDGALTAGKVTTYRIKRPIPGMTIDAATGAWGWTPTSAQVGNWQVTILATVDGKDVTVLTWSVAVH